MVRLSSPPHHSPRSPSTIVSRPRSESPPPSPSPYSRSPPPKRPRTTRSPRSESRDTSSPPPRAKPRAPKHSKQADFTRLRGLFIGTVEYQVEGGFVVLMWALLLRCACATSQVTVFLGEYPGLCVRSMHAMCTQCNNLALVHLVACCSMLASGIGMHESHISGEQWYGVMFQQ